MYAWIGGRRVHGRHLRGIIPGIRYAYYWYYDDCYVLTDDYGWVNICGYYTDRLTDGTADFLPGLLLA
jgi:hypothetical protein